MKVIIYGAEWCKPCQNAKQLCEIRDIDYEFKDITANPEYHKEATDKLGSEPKSVPHIFVDNKYIGQSSDFMKYMDTH